MVKLRRRRLRTGVLALVLALLLAACEQPRDPVTFSGATMGTVWTVRVSQLPAGVSGPQLRADIEALLEQVNAEMSTYREDSDITRFNRAGAGEAMVIPEGFAYVLEQALALAAETGGAFDPTVGPLVNLWGFGPDPVPDEVPDEEAIVATMERASSSVCAIIFSQYTWHPASRAMLVCGACQKSGVETKTASILPASFSSISAASRYWLGW